MALTPRQKQARRLWKMRALGLGYEDGGGGPSLTEQVIAFFGSGEEGGIWDFTDAANLATATDGTGAVSNGSAIAYCADLSGNANHLTQLTAGLRPSWNASGYAAFNSDSMFVGWASASQPMSRVSRIQVGVWVNNTRLFSGGASLDHTLIQNPSSPKVVMFEGSSSAQVDLPLSAYNTVYELFNGASSVLDIAGSGTSVSVGTGASDGFTLGSEFGGASGSTDLQVSRVMMINRALTSGELAAAKAWVEEVL